MISHYEIWQTKGPENVQKDNLWNLEVDEVTRKRLLKEFKIKPTDIVLEVGAYQGDGTLRLSEIAKKVIAIEADPYNFSILQKKVIGKNVDCLNLAASKDYGEGIFYKGKTEQQKTLQKNSLSNIEKVEKIRFVPLDDFVKEANYITLEVNLGELDALKGMENLLKSRPRIIAAGWYSLKEKPAAYEIKKYLENLGFEVYIGRINRIYAL